MTPKKQPQRRKLTTGLIVAIAVVVCSAWGLVSYFGKEQPPEIPQEFTIEALKRTAEDPGRMFEQVHQVMSRPELTEDQRQAIRENIHAVMEVHMDRRLDEYFAAGGPQQQQAVLDRHLNEMQSRMKEWQQRRAQREAETARSGATARAAPPGSPAPPPGPGGIAGPPPGGPPPGGPHRPHTREERKMHSESRDPDRAARRMAYFTALRERAEQRGIQMPFGPGRPHGS